MMDKKIVKKNSTYSRSCLTCSSFDSSNTLGKYFGYCFKNRYHIDNPNNVCEDYMMDSCRVCEHLFGGKNHYCEIKETYIQDEALETSRCRDFEYKKEDEDLEDFDDWDEEGDGYDDV